MESLRETIINLQTSLNNLVKELDLEKKRKEFRRLEAKSIKTDFWKNETEAKTVLQEMSDLQETMQLTDDLNSKLEENLKLVDLAKQETKPDAELKKEILKEVNKIKSQIKKLKLQTYFSGPFDKENAIISLHAGQGGVEAMDWTVMLLRMYTRFIERQRWKWKLAQETPGEEAGIKSATVFIQGKYAYGFLKGEAGVHRLVRQSPFNADQLRQTSFALVEVLPQVKEPEEGKIRDEDIQFKAFRASSHGGQNVNKVSTAVRLKHIPSGIVVECQTQRYQEQNRRIAMQLLIARLWEKKQREHQEKVKSLKGKHKVAGWGNQIRSYVLHPYHLVKDLRTEIETTDTDAVLDGKLETFIDAQIRQLSH